MPTKPDEPDAAGCTRRVLLGVAAAVGASWSLGALAEPAGVATKLRPQPGDRLVFAAGERAGQLIAPPHLARGAAPVSAWPMDPKQQVRDGSRLNLLRVLRLDPGLLSAKTAASAADGIVAYSGMCSHAGCEVTGWIAATCHLACPCHGSEFAALDAAAIAKGPAARPLAMLPIRVEGDALLVVRAFTRAVGFKPL